MSEEEINGMLTAAGLRGWSRGAPLTRAQFFAFVRSVTANAWMNPDKAPIYQVRKSVGDIITF